jgi:hypothetical protein
VSGILSSLKGIKVWGGWCTSFASTMAFYMRDLSIRVSLGVLRDLLWMLCMWSSVLLEISGIGLGMCGLWQGGPLHTWGGRLRFEGIGWHNCRGWWVHKLPNRPRSSQWAAYVWRPPAPQHSSLKEVSLCFSSSLQVTSWSPPAFCFTPSSLT